MMNQCFKVCFDAMFWKAPICDQINTTYQWCTLGAVCFNITVSDYVITIEFGLLNTH